MWKREKKVFKKKKTKQIKKENSSSVSSNSDTDDDNDVDSWQELTTKSKQKEKAPSKWNKVHKELQFIRQKLSESNPQKQKQKQIKKRVLSDEDSFSEEDERALHTRKQPLSLPQRNTSSVVPAKPKYHFM